MFLRRLDISIFKVRLGSQGSNEVETNCAGCCTLCLGIIYVLSFISFCVAVFNTSLEVVSLSDARSYENLDGRSYFTAISIEKNDGTPIQNFERYFKISVHGFENSQVVISDAKKCGDVENYLNESDLLKDIDTSFVNKYYCFPRKFDLKSTFETSGFLITYCQSSERNDCISKEQIQKEIGVVLINLVWNSDLITKYFYENRIIKTYNSKTIYSSVSLSRQDVFFFKLFSLEYDTGKTFDHITSLIGINDYKLETSYLPVSSDTNSLYEITYTLDTMKSRYVRPSLKVGALASRLGGILMFYLMILYIFTKRYNHAMFLDYTIKKIFGDSSNNIKNNESVELNNQIQIQNNKEVSEFINNNREGIQVQNFQSFKSNLKSKFIESLNKKSKIDSSEYYSSNFCSILSFILCLCCFKNKNTDLLYKLDTHLSKVLSVDRYLELNEETESFKQVLFEEDIELNSKFDSKVKENIKLKFVAASDK